MKPFLHTPQLKKSNIANPTLRRNKHWKLRCVAWMALLLLAQATMAQTWTPQTSNTTSNFTDMSGIGTNNIWAVSAEGTIVNYDGASWTINPQILGGVSVWCADATHVWISTRFDIRYYDGTSWTTQAFGGILQFYTIWGLDAMNVWSAGNAGSNRRYNGTSWTVQPSASATIRGIWGTDPSNLWAVGTSGALRKFNGTSWATQTSPTSEALLGIWGADATHIWAVGGGGTILKYDGNFWEIQTSPTTQQLNAIWGVDANNIWAVGNTGTILKYDGNSWEEQNPVTPNNLTSVWGTSTEMWAVGATGTILHSTDQPFVLPVELSAFQARLQADQTALLHWQTATEHNNAGFDIERSADGKNWEKIGFVSGHGNSQEQRAYQFIDPRPVPGTNFYRLVQMDADGSATYSDIRSVVLADGGKPGFRMFPNPVTQGQLTLQLSEEPDENASVSIFSDAGNLLLQQPVESSVQQADLNGWAPGIYLIEVKNAGTTWREHVVLGQ